MLEAWPNSKELQTQICNEKMSGKPNCSHHRLCHQTEQEHK